MLAHNGVIFAHHHFFGDIARVFLGYIEKSSISRAKQFNFDIGWFRHGPFLLEIDKAAIYGRLYAALIAAPIIESQAPKVKPWSENQH